MSRRRTRSEAGSPPARAPRQIAALLLVWTWVATADGAPLEDVTDGGAVFTGPTSAHASSIFLNPAALGFAGRGFHFQMSGSLRLDSIHVDRRIEDPAGQFSPGPSVSTTTWSPGGTIAVYSTVLQERAVFGASLHTTTFDRFPSDEYAIGYHVLGGHIYQALVSAAGCFRLTDDIMFGLGVSIGYAGLDLDLLRDTALEAGGDAERGIASDCGGAPCGFENPQAAEIDRIHTSTGGLSELFSAENLALSAGLAVQVKRGWWVTMAMMSPPGAIPARDYALRLSGTAEVTSAPRDGSQLHSGRAEATYQMPYSVWAGTRGPILPGYDLVASARWQNLSRHGVYDFRLYGDDLTGAGVPEWYPRYSGLRDVWQGSVGLEGQETGGVRYGGRLRVESGATTPATTSPLQIDGFDMGAAVGIELHLTQHLVFQLGYDLTWFPEVNSTDSAFDPIARIDCVDSDYNFDQCQAVRDGRALPTAAGRYRRLRQAMSLSFRYDSL